MYVWVLQAIEDGGEIELHGVFEDLEQAKHHLETKYPNLREWTQCKCGCDNWWSHTNKHPVMIEKATYYSAPIA